MKARRTALNLAAWTLVAWMMAAPTLAADVDGKWSGVISDAPLGADPIELQMKADGERLAGTVKTKFLGTARIADGVVKDGKLSFNAYFTPPTEGLSPFTIHFEATSKGEQLDMTSRVGADPGTAVQKLKFVVRRADTGAGGR